MGTHEEPPIERQPTLVMHEDDPVLFHRWSRVLNRRNVKRVGFLMGIITGVLILTTLYLTIQAVVAISNERDQRRQDVNSGICAIIDAVPPGDARIDTVRVNFTCGPYIPEPSGFFGQTPTSSPSSSPRVTQTSRSSVAPTPTPIPSVVTETTTTHATTTVVRTTPGPIITVPTTVIITIPCIPVPTLGCV